MKALYVAVSTIDGVTRYWSSVIHGWVMHIDEATIFVQQEAVPASLSESPFVWMWRWYERTERFAFA